MKTHQSAEKLQVREVTTELRKAHCVDCKTAVEKGIALYSAADCPLRGKFHGTPTKLAAQGHFAALLRLLGFNPMVMVARTHNLITNVGHAAANGRMSNQGSYSPFVNLAIGLGTSSAVATDQALGQEITSGGGQRAAATATQVTTSVANDTTQLVHTWTFTTSFAVTEEGIFDSATGATVTTTTQSRISTDTTVTVASGTGITNNDYLQWEAEIVQVTSGGGTGTLTITRGQKGTTAASHASGVGLTDINTSANMLATQVFSAVNVNNGDSLQVTHKYQS